MQQRIRPRYELTNYRWMAGLTIPLLAKAIGTNTTTLQRWEAGTQDPQPEFVEKLCTFFDVDHPKKLNLDVQFTAPSQS